MTSIRIHSPEGGVGGQAGALAPSPDVLTGLRIAVLDNGKPGAAQLMQQLALRLGERTGAECVGVRRKASAATPCQDELLEELVGSAHVVLTGTAD